MKIILSHDVDHLRGFEHLKDRYLIGVILKSLISLIRRDISFKVFLTRLLSFRRLERISEVFNFDKKFHSNPTFFFAMEKGLRLSYDRRATQKYIHFLKNNGALIGIHGINFDSFEKMNVEKTNFVNLFKFEPIGIRNHYLRQSTFTKSIMNELEYSFDSTDYKISNPFKHNNLWEFPISIMDVSLGIDTTLEHKKEISLSVYNNAIEKKIKYFVINFHDVYYSESYPTMKAWYEWFVSFLSNKHDFISFQEALLEIENH